MVRNSRSKPKNVNITTPSVVVNSTGAVGNPTGATARNRRRNLARRRRQASAVNNTRGVIENTSGMELLSLQDMNAGRMTSDPSSDVSFIRSLRCCGVEMDENTEGWYFKYLDPAGSVETARAIGEFSKIPDGLLTFSVDAEIRTIDTLPVPLIEGEVDTPGALPLSGLTWSLTIFSYPMFRTAYIAVANRFDKEISTTIASELAFTLNNLTDYRATIDSNTWSPFAETVEEGWFYWIKPLPPTYNLADPVIGDQRTLTSWRMSYKSLTIEHNAPTLIDQGFWNGGHYALDSTNVTQQTPVDTEMLPTIVHGRTSVTFDTSSPTLARYYIRIPNLVQLISVSGPASLVLVNNPDNEFYIQVTGDNTAGFPVSWIVPSGQEWFNPFEGIFAEPGDTISFTGAAVPGGYAVTFTSTHVAAVAFTLTFPALSPTSTVVVMNTEATVGIYTSTAFPIGDNRNSSQIEFPAYNPSQIAANNPKMEQFLMKETNGAYIVHKKMRKPVFEVTPAGSFGPIQFTTPDYSVSRNSNDGSGILDTIDANFSTASICIRGIAHANVPVVKTYQGWEGITNVNTPFGQFGHTGLPRNNAVMELVDNLTVRTTGVYPANDNFLGLIAKFAASALKNILSSEATPALLGNLAQSVIDKGLSYANDKLGQVGQRTIRRSATNSRRFARRALMG